MVTHHITAAHNGLFWTIARNRDGDIIERNIEATSTLDSHHECTCGATFKGKRESVAHLKEIMASDNGESVTEYPDGIKVKTTAEGNHA